MDINPIKPFIRENISEFRLIEKRGKTRIFDLYDKNGKYCGKYDFFPINRTYSDYFGKNISMSTLQIFDKKLNKIMQEHVSQKKDYVEVKDHTKDIPVKLIPQTITTITTFLDFVNDCFKTVRRESSLKNELVRIGKNDKDFIYNENHIIYEELKEKPVYEQKVELLREGSISEVKEETRYNIKRRDYFAKKHSGIPFIFW